MIRYFFVAFSLVVLIVSTSCTKPQSSDTSQSPSGGSQAGGDEHGDGEHGPSLDLGSTTVDGKTIRAARDAGAIMAGGEAAIDAWVSGGSAKVKAVRFWIGTEDASGSVKGLAAIEDQAKQNWHTHVEVPSPTLDGSKLWVEVEDETGDKTLASFDLEK